VKTFHFNLQALQTLRQRQEQKALEQYGQAVSARQSAFEKFEAVRKHCEASWALCREQITHGATAAQLAQAEAYCFSVEEQKKQCEAAVNQAQTVVDERWQTLLAARQQREAVDKYREHQFERYERELLREEQKLLDDVASRRAPVATWRFNSLEARN
jgi:flagellar FliJ protein